MKDEQIAWHARVPKLPRCSFTGNDLGINACAWRLPVRCTCDGGTRDESDAFGGERGRRPGATGADCGDVRVDRRRPGQGRRRAGKDRPCGGRLRDFQPGMDAQRPRGHGGDGLGPVYNDSSCMACHNSGGSGGAGPASKNIDILTASGTFGGMLRAATPVRASSRGSSAKPSFASAASPSSLLDALTRIHSGFRTSRNVVLHKFGTDPNYDAWRSRTLRSPGPRSAAANDSAGNARRGRLAGWRKSVTRTREPAQVEGSSRPWKHD